MKAKGKNEGPLKIEMPFDEAIKRALTIAPPKEGWAAYEKKIKRDRKRRKPKNAA
jgi:hypothetical protein